MTEHNMHTDLFDDKGRKRAGVFYKAAYYDRRASITLNPRYSYRRIFSNPENHTFVIKDGDTVIHKIVEESQLDDLNDWQTDDRARDRSEAWLEENYPKWQDKTAYWEDSA